MVVVDCWHSQIFILHFILYEYILNRIMRGKVNICTDFKIVIQNFMKFSNFCLLAICKHTVLGMFNIKYIALLFHVYFLFSALWLQAKDKLFYMHTKKWMGVSCMSDIFIVFNFQINCWFNSMRFKVIKKGEKKNERNLWKKLKWSNI